MLTLKSIISDLSTEQINKIVATGIRAGGHSGSNSSDSSMSSDSASTGTNTGTGTNTNTGGN